ncbi:MAG: GlsB/YeaQ/YmgE family stress response membrane protein [Acidobacteria bacterium]|nr:GlsB/YeaQ/YmgE family stress response membrane protein [Acidobacteriota bacterium]
MTLTSLIWFLLIGLIAGWLAGRVMRGGGYGVVGDMIIGIIGSLLGGWLFGLLGIGAGGGLIGALITAFVGAVVLIFLLRLIRRA